MLLSADGAVPPHSPTKSHTNTVFWKRRAALKPKWKNCSRAATKLFSPHSSTVRLPLCIQRHNTNQLYLIQGVLNIFLFSIITGKTGMWTEWKHKPQRKKRFTVAEASVHQQANQPLSRVCGSVWWCWSQPPRWPLGFGLKLVLESRECLC